MGQLPAQLAYRLWGKTHRCEITGAYEVCRASAATGQSMAAVMQEVFEAGLSWRRPPVEKGRALPGSWRCAGDGLFSLRRQGAIPSQRLSAGRAVPVWQLLRMLYPATAIAVAMAATSPEGAHGGDSHAAELLTVQNGGMDSDTQPIQT
jgi:hypothetical protein